MSTIAAAVFDAIVEGRGYSMREAIKALPDIDRAVVANAIHRLRDLGILSSHREAGLGAVYTITPGATRPTDGRGRPRRIAATPRSETSLLGRCHPNAPHALTRWGMCRRGSDNAGCAAVKRGAVDRQRNVSETSG
jgi:hypothetical protein